MLLHYAKSKVLQDSSSGSSEDEYAGEASASYGKDLTVDSTLFFQCSTLTDLRSGMGFRAKVCACCSGCIGCGLSCVLLLIFLAFNLNRWLAAAIETVGGSLLGVNVSVSSVHIGLIEGRASISRLLVASPPGFQGTFLDLDNAVFDIGPASLLAVMTSNRPLELEELSIMNLHVFIDQLAPKMSNALVEVQHMCSVTQARTPTAATSKEAAEDPPAKALNAMTTKIRVGRIQFDNITVDVCNHPCEASGPSRFTLRKNLIKHVGSSAEGVYLYEVIEMLIFSILQSVIKAAPNHLRRKLLKALGNSLGEVLNYGDVAFDVAGDGRQEVILRSKYSNVDIGIDLVVEGVKGCAPLKGPPLVLRPS
mmetsp:Transcript_71927/g.159141  ORF Transcript_71927/g.159141 Transcript_71927/m.159141 type:complete len:365 (-) Transcript_71927:63-1157(-)